MLRINQGENSNLDASKPEMDRNKKPDEMQNKSIRGLLFSFRQYANWINK